MANDVFRFSLFNIRTSIIGLASPASSSILLSGTASQINQKQVERIKELEVEVFDLKKKLERAESRLVY